MMYVRRLLFALLLAAGTSAAVAQTPGDFPSRPVKLVVPFAPGGPTDVVARILADLLSTRWNGQSVVIENRPGAGTIVATAAVAKSPPDGHTMLVATNSLLINPAIGQKLPYDTEKEFAPVSMVATQPVALVANKAFPANTIPEVVALAKKSAEPLNFTSPGPRGVGHLAGEMLKQRAGIDMTHINYNGSAPALTDVIAGRVPLMFDIWHSAKRHVDSGGLKLIAGAGKERLVRCAAGADHRRDLSGLRRDRVQRHGGAGRHAAGLARQALGRYPRRGQLAGICREDPQPRHLPARQHAEGTRCLDARTDRPLEGDRGGGQHQGGLGMGMRRRKFITLFASAAAASAVCGPSSVLAQPSERMRRIGVLVASAEDESDIQARLSGFREGLEKLGWLQGRNVHVDTRFAAGRADQYQTLAKELIALQPDVILAHSPPIAAALQRETRSIPIVFVSVSDPIGAGFVANLARPGGNLTGLMQYEAGITGKWLAMLKEISPSLSRAALLGNPRTTAFDFFLRAAEAAAPSLSIELVPSRVGTSADIERAIVDFARVPNGGLLLPPDSTSILNRDLIISLAARHRLPSVYPLRVFVQAGGLMSYATDQVEILRQAATYIDRILRGAKPTDLPVQAPTKYETIINLKTAKALGLTLPPALLVAADEVIE